MSDDKQKTRAQLLNELESIKDLLDEEDELLGLEPPLLTVPAEDEEDAPLLTEVHQEPLPATEPIPVLADEQALDEAALLEKEAEEAQNTIDAEPVSEPRSSEPKEPTTATEEELSQSPDPTEEQPSLFEAPVSASEKPEQPPVKRPSLSSGRGENPFLPKHIRDRLTANRPSQPPMVDYFAPLPATAPLPDTPPAAEPLEPTDQQLIDELVKRFLPEIEAALRERLQTMAREERGSHTTEPED